MKSNKFGGISFYICVGKWDKISFRMNKEHVRLCLGWIAVSLTFYDIEAWHKKVCQFAIQQDDEVQRLKTVINSIVNE